MALVETVLGLLVEYVVHLPHASGEVLQAHGLRRLCGSGRPELLYCPGNLFHFRCWRTGTDGVGEDVHLCEAALLNERQGGGKLILCLSGKAHD